MGFGQKMRMDKHSPNFARNFSGYLLLLMSWLLWGISPLPSFGFLKWRSEEKKLVIPDFDTAQEQFAYASSLHVGVLPSLDKKKRRQQLERWIQAYSKVVERFPDDKTYTPLAYLTVAECQADLGKIQIARSMFREATERWGDNELVVARAMYDLAVTLDQEQRYSESQQIYREIIERFKDSQKPGVGEIVKKAQARYYLAKEEPVKKKPLAPLGSFFKRLNPFSK